MARASCFILEKRKRSMEKTCCLVGQKLLWYTDGTKEKEAIPMKKINTTYHTNKDRVICVTSDTGHDFYYQPAKTKARYWLNHITPSPSIQAYFQKRGRDMNGLGVSLTLHEIYNFKDYHNYKLSCLMNRFPGQIEYVIKEYILNEPIIEDRSADMHVVSRDYSESCDFDRVA